MPELLEEVLRAALAITFVWSGGAKFGSPRRLSDAVAGITSTSPGAALFAARLFSLLEVTTAVLLVFSQTAWSGTIMAMGLGGAIFGLSAYAAATKRVYSCGCFGSKSFKPIGLSNAAYGALIVAAAGALAVLDGAGGSGGPSDSLRLACVVASCVLVGLLLGSARELQRPIDNFTSGRA